jgi:hypothetical protein
MRPQIMIHGKQQIGPPRPFPAKRSHGKLKTTLDRKAKMTSDKLAIFERQFLNPGENPFARLADSHITHRPLCKVVPIISYPRSRNGWIRHLIAAYLIASRLELDQGRLATMHALTLEGNAPAIHVDGIGVFPVDIIVPDVYFFLNGTMDRLLSLPGASLCLEIVNDLPIALIKTHHACHDMTAFPLVTALVRPPSPCVASATFLLDASRVTNASVEQMNSVADEMHKFYLEYMNSYERIAQNMPLIAINSDNPLIGIIRILQQLGNFTSQELGLMLELIGLFPSRSTFPAKTLYEKIVIERCPQRSLDIFHKLTV